MRWRIAKSMGDSPEMARNLRLNVETDILASSPISFKVRRSHGWFLNRSINSRIKASGALAAGVWASRQTWARIW